MERDGLVYGMPEDEYHGGGAAELSSSGAKLLLEAAAIYKYVVVDSNRTEKKAWDVGSAVHSKVLGVGDQPIAYPAELLSKTGSVTPTAKTWAVEQRTAGRIPMKKHEIDHVNAVAEALLANADARAMLELPGHPEVSGFATCPDTGARLRARLDRLPDNFDVIVDVKTTGQRGGANESEFYRTIAKLGYDVQAGQYTDTFRYITGEDRDFAFIVVETVPPFLSNVIKITPEYMDMGRGKSMEARKRYMRGIETGVWPGYEPGIKTVAPPIFAVVDYEDNYETEEMQL